MARSIWKGNIGFGLVSIGVELLPMEAPERIDFDLLDKRDMSPIGYRKVSKETGKEVDKEDIVRGFDLRFTPPGSDPNCIAFPVRVAIGSHVEVTSHAHREVAVAHETDTVAGPKIEPLAPERERPSGLDLQRRCTDPHDRAGVAQLDLEFDRTALVGDLQRLLVIGESDAPAARK